MEKIIKLTEEQVTLTFFFHKPENRSDANKFLTTAQLIKILEDKSQKVLSPKKLRDALHDFGFEYWKNFNRAGHPWVWSLYEIDHTKNPNGYNKFLQRRKENDSEYTPTFKRLSLEEIKQLKSGDLIYFTNKEHLLISAEVVNIHIATIPAYPTCSTIVFLSKNYTPDLKSFYAIDSIYNEIFVKN